MKKFFNSYLILPSNQAFLNGSEAAGLIQAMQQSKMILFNTVSQVTWPLKEMRLG